MSTPRKTTHHTTLANMQTKLANELPVSLTTLVGGPGSEEFNAAYQRLEAWIKANQGAYGLRILITMRGVYNHLLVTIPPTSIRMLTTMTTCHHLPSTV